MTKASNHPHDKHHAIHHAASSAHHSATKKVSHASPHSHAVPHFHAAKVIPTDSATSIFDRLKKLTTHQQHNKKQIRETVLEKVTRLMQFGGQFGQELFVGFNTVQRHAEQRHLAVIVIAKDGKESLIHHLMEIAIVLKIPYLLLPSFSNMLKETLQIKHCFCFGVPKEGLQQKLNTTNKSVKAKKKDKKEKKENGEEEGVEEDETSKEAALDELRDYLVHLAMTSTTGNIQQ